MSTPDAPAPGALPGELRLHGPSLTPPTATTAPSPPVSPGVSGAALRSPTTPTLPDPEPAGLLMAITRVANELFSAPAGVAPPTSTTAPSPSPPAASPPALAPPTPTAPTAAPAALPLAPPSAPSAPSALSAAPANPFSATPDFASLFSQTPNDAGLPDAFSVPLVDPASVPTPAPPATTPPATPPPTTTLPTTPFELQPTVEPSVRPSPAGFDALAVKAEFPILQERVHGKQLVWLDNAATTQKPRVVIERIKTFYEKENSNIHRAAHALAARATDAYESARESVRRFVNAASVRDVIFVRGTTEGINLVAQAWGRANVRAGDEIVVTHLEHHANIVPWQLLAKATGATIKVAPVDDDGQILLDDYERLLSERTKIVSLTQVSNALGTVTPAQQMIEMAKRRGIKVLLDGAQSVSHMRVDLQTLRPDFFVFSGHKVFGPTGIGAVVAPAALMDATPPWQGGGNMIEDVTFEHTRFQPSPARFEAGTGNIADAVGLGAAVDWVTRTGIENIGRHEHDLLVYGTEKLLTVPGLRIIGNAKEKAGVLSFVIAGRDTQQIAQALDKEGIAVRGGHHCAQPILRRMGVESTVRASLAPYNTTDDLDVLVAALCRLVAS